MSASEAFYEAMRNRLSKTTDPKVIDQLLDFWNDATNLATEFDAAIWGFHPEKWRAEDRATMEARIANEAKRAVSS